MNDDITPAILRVAEARGESGVPMGALVDELVATGYPEQQIELAIWDLLQQRRLTPHGFVARTIMHPARKGHARQRVYEFILIPWSPALDRQLDLQLGSDAEGASGNGRGPR